MEIGFKFASFALNIFEVFHQDKQQAIFLKGVLEKDGTDMIKMFGGMIVW